MWGETKTRAPSPAPWEGGTQERLPPGRPALPPTGRRSPGQPPSRGGGDVHFLDEPGESVACPRGSSRGPVSPRPRPRRGPQGVLQHPVLTAGPPRSTLHALLRLRPSPPPPGQREGGLEEPIEAGGLQHTAGDRAHTSKEGPARAVRNELTRDASRASRESRWQGTGRRPCREVASVRTPGDLGKGSRQRAWQARRPGAGVCPGQTVARGGQEALWEGVRKRPPDRSLPCAPSSPGGSRAGVP